VRGGKEGREGEIFFKFIFEIMKKYLNQKHYRVMPQQVMAKIFRFVPKNRIVQNTFKVRRSETK
jgi:hypothetical protein